jgi:hypothetical protein
MARDRQFFLERSYVKAFGQFDEKSWEPLNGFAANEARILKLYDYYRDTYLARPDQFLWAGLGRMAGGAVVGGLRLAVSMGPETFFTQTMVRIGKEIFHDLAWQHEAVLDDEANALTLAAARDAAAPARRSYRDAWTHILSGDPGRVATGNKMLLENEQFSIIQPRYDDVVARDPKSGFWGIGSPMRSLKAFTNSIHPYHRDFLLSQPSGDVVNPDNRWSWITETGGMYEKWAEKRGVPVAPIAMSRAERVRLVSLTMSQIIRREFAPVDQSLMPPGAFDI